jgi:hypothetical protein
MSRASYASNPTFAALPKDKQDAITAGVAAIKAEYEGDVALFDYERRTKARERVQSAARQILDAFKFRGCLGDVESVLMNGETDARRLKEALEKLVDDPWTIYPEAVYHPAFDWDSGAKSKSLNFGRHLAAEAVRALAALLEGAGVKVASYQNNPGFKLLQELVAAIPVKMGPRTIQRALAE